MNALTTTYRSGRLAAETDMATELQGLGLVALTNRREHWAAVARQATSLSFQEGYAHAALYAINARIDTLTPA